MASSASGEVVDGRRLRSERSRQAIIEAAIVLMQEGVLVATAQQIAERAGVGIRSFFRHFDDMEALARAVDEYAGDSWRELFAGGDRSGTLEERLEHAVARHADAYEQVSNTILSTSAQLWRYEALRQNYAKVTRRLRSDLDDWMPELKSLSRQDREAVDAIASFETWNRLRQHQRLGKKVSAEVVTTLLKALILTD